MTKDILIGIDAGTSVIKAVAFDLLGQQIAKISIPNTYKTLSDGTATQSMEQTWNDCTKALYDLNQIVPNLANSTAAIGVTGQGDGTWLIDHEGVPIDDAWLWLDSRSAQIVEKLRADPTDRTRFEYTGTGLNSCQQGAQLAYMKTHMPAMLNKAKTAFHCKDWLYYKLTTKRATDPSEASFTFGNYKTRTYEDSVIEILGLSAYRYLLPQIIDGSSQTHPLSKAAANQSGLLEGTPVSLGFVDVVCTAMGAGAYTGSPDIGCSIIGTTGMHIRATPVDKVVLNTQSTGYIMALPIPNMVGMMQTNMASTLNIDWVFNLVKELFADFNQQVSHKQLIKNIDLWVNKGKIGSLLFHPYISEAGERGPFIDNNARASFIGLNTTHRFPDIIRAIIEGIGMASRDCYEAMGEMPREIRLTGGAAKSPALRHIIAASLGVNIRYSLRDEAGAAGCAMMAAVAIGAYDTMDDCINTWVSPSLSEIEKPNLELVEIYRNLFTHYISTRHALKPIWHAMAQNIGG